MRYPVALHTDDGQRNGVTVPDLPGCFSAGDTLDEALESAQESIDLQLGGLAEDGQEIPAAGSTAHYAQSGDFQGAIWAPVEVDTSRFNGRVEKINITMPRRILARVDDYVKSHGLTRSGFLTQAAEKAMR